MSVFSFSHAQLQNFTEQAIEAAQLAGATSVAVNIAENKGQTVTVRLDEIETIAYNRDNSLNITAYVGQRQGSASTSNMSKDSIQETAAAAVSIAQYTAEDQYAGLADPDLFARQFFDLDLYHPTDISVEQMITLAQEMEQSGMAIDSRIDNSGGATISTQQEQSIYANSLGFSVIEQESYYHASVALIAKTNDTLQQDYWLDATRKWTDLLPMASIGAQAGQRVIQRLNARRIKTQQAPVLFDASIAGSLINHWVAAVSGSNLYRRASFLVDSLDQLIFSPIVEIEELPHLPRGFASCNFDAEGVATQKRKLIDKGILQGYFLNSYAARKLAMQTTANAGGPHNLWVKATHPDLASLLKEMNRGLLVTELMGQGINLVTGDYSRGASGFWVENGEIQYPVEEITIAGNLKTLFQKIVAIGADHLRYSSKQCGSILISDMMIAGES